MRTWLYKRESQADPDHEDAARAGLSEAGLDKAALMFHYGFAVSWAPIYALLRPAALCLGPLAAVWHLVRRCARSLTRE